MAIKNPLPRTLLPLFTYAKILGLNPMHFAGAVAPTVGVMPTEGCDDIWFKYEWQDYDKVSRWEVAEEIKTAEQEIANFLGFWPSHYWMENELIRYPKPFSREHRGNGRDVASRTKAVHLKYGKFINPGQRAVSLIDTATVAGGELVYSDDDGDGYFETATITVATTLTDVNEIKVFHASVDGALEWEIRPVREKSISGGNAVIVIDSWQLINPELYEALPTSANGAAVDVSSTSNFVISVDVYREYIDTTQTSADFYWESGYLAGSSFTCPNCGTIGCTVCGYDSQTGCLIARSHDNSEVVAYPATYNADTALWDVNTWVACVEPDIVRASYLSGDQSQEYLQGRTHEPLSLFWAQVIAWIATARLPRPLCACGVIQDRVTDLATDLAHFTRGDTHFVTPDVMNCPFGTRRGEVMAWRRLLRMPTDRRLNVALA